MDVVDVPGPDKIEDHGLFGDIETAPEPPSVFLFGTALFAVAALARRRATGH